MENQTKTQEPTALTRMGVILPQNLLKKTKLLAWQRNTTISEIVRSFLEHETQNIKEKLT